MLFLLLSILCSSAMSIVMRVSKGRVKSGISMLAANYFACMLTALCFMGPSRIFVSGEGMGHTFQLGMLNGVFYVSALVSNRYSISRIGMVLPSVFSRMGGLLVPLAFSMLMFGEVPDAFQVVGAMLAIAGILLMNLHSGSGKAGCTAPLIVLLFAEGMASAMAKIYGETGSAALSDHFLFFTFGSAFLLCLVLLLARHERPGRWEMLFGVLMGVPNFLATRFVLWALEALPSFIVYPSRSVGTISVVALVGVLAFGEKLRRRQVAALAVIFVALVLLNI